MESYILDTWHWCSFSGEKRNSNSPWLWLLKDVEMCHDWLEVERAKWQSAVAADRTWSEIRSLRSQAPPKPWVFSILPHQGSNLHSQPLSQCQYSQCKFLFLWNKVLSLSSIICLSIFPCFVDWQHYVSWPQAISISTDDNWGIQEPTLTMPAPCLLQRNT